MKLSHAELLEIKEQSPEIYAAIVQRLQIEAEKAETPPYVEALFGPQLAFYADPAKKKTAVCSRRAGKTEAVAAWLLDGGRDDPGGLSVYIALSRNNCRLILWTTLKHIDKRHALGLRFKEQDNQLMVVLPNGHSIFLAGCKDSAEIEKFRGLKLRRAAIDEGASYGPYLKQLVEDVLEPALLDLNGEICIIGTPGVSPAGYFFEITTGAGTLADSAAQWPSVHTWTMEVNPHIQLADLPTIDQAEEVRRASRPGYRNKRATRYLEQKLTSNKWTPDHPTYRREWLGEWVRDGQALVYPYNPAINECHAKDMPPIDRTWTYALGVDIGFNDPCAFVVGCYRPGHPEIYIVHAEKHEKMIPSVVAAHIERLHQRFNFSRVVMDTGGIGKGYIEEANQRFDVFIEPAEKRKKTAFIELMHGDMMSGNIKVDPRQAGELVQEWNNLVWDEKRQEPDSRFDDHLSDACLYLWRALLPYYRPELVRRPLTRAEQVDKQALDFRARLAASQRKRARQDNMRSLMAKIANGRPMY